MTLLVGRTGCIDWPDALRTGLGNGMWVYAFWLADHTLKPRHEVTVGELLDGINLGGITFRDPFVKCTGPDQTLALPEPGTVASSTVKDVYPPERRVPVPAPWNAADRAARERYLSWSRDAGASILAGICLGTIGCVLIDDFDRPWECTFNDLSRAGKRLVRQLNKLYGRDATFVTYLDV